MQKRLKEEMDRYNKFRRAMLGKTAEALEEQKEVDIRNYAKYILKEGTSIEKRELLSNLQSKLVIKDKQVDLI